MLAMVLFLIISLTLTGLESARINAIHTMANWNLETALQAVLGEYYEPLFDEYGIYGLYEEDIDEELNDYLMAAVNPLEGSSKSKSKQSNGLKLRYSIDEVEVTNCVGLLDGGGKIVERQMMEEGAINGIANVAEIILDAVHLLDQSSAASGILKEKMAAEQELSYMDAELIYLMQALDGAPVCEQGFVVDSKGNLICGVSFVKRMVPGAVSQSVVGVDHKGMYEALSGSYVNVKRMFEQLFELKELSIKSTGKDKAAYEKKLAGKEMELKLLLGSCGKACTLAIESLDKLIEYQNKVKPKVEKLEKLLKNGKELLGESLYQQYLEELSEMKKYAGMTLDNGTYDFVKMRRTVLDNQALLMKMSTLYDECHRIGGRNWELTMHEMETLALEYSFQGLKLDYSNIRATVVKENKSAWKAICDFVLKGIDSYLFTGEEELSERALISDELPSKCISGGEKSLYRFPEISKGDLKKTKFIENYLSSGAMEGVSGFLKQSMEQIGEKLLLVAYISTHFGNYTEHEPEGALYYQQEYILFGSMKDRTNARDAALSILGVRMALNMAHVLMDSSLRSEATAIATELVGGLGLPFLIVICEYVMLFACAAQNALLETIEILQGKKVPFLVSNATMQVRLEEAFAMTKSALHNRAGAYPGGKGFCLKYADYLLVFMLTVNRDRLCYRAMDVMQENIRTCYDRNFYMSKCLHSFGVQMTIGVEPLFSRISFGDGRKNVGKWTYVEKAAIGY